MGRTSLFSGLTYCADCGSKLYEDNALGKITDERFEKLSATYEKERKELADNVSKAETDIAEAEKDNVDMKVFLKTVL